MAGDPERSRKTFNKNYKINKKTGCWDWIGQIGWHGYAIQSGFRAHRLSWILYKGLIPKGLLVCHKCDNRSCVNPKHLWTGTHKQNMKDCSRKGRISLIGVEKASRLNVGRKLSKRECEIRSKNTKAWMNSPRSKEARIKSAIWRKSKECSKIRRKSALKQWKKKKALKNAT